MNTTYYTSQGIASRDVEAAISIILGLGLIFWLICLCLVILTIVAKWKVFKKANVDGWECLIPIHNEVVELKLGGIKTYWYFLNLLFICGIGPIILSFWSRIELAKAFGKGAGFGVLMVFFPYICYPILAWGNAEYKQPDENN